MTLRNRILPQDRIQKFKLLLEQKKHLAFIEAHNGLSGIIVNTTQVNDADGITRRFDGIWVSSLTDSAAKGHPDTGVIDPSSRLETIQQISQVTDIPLIVDGDTGGETSHFEYFCAKLESMGVAAVVIEDKQFPKRNSLEAGAIQLLEDPEQFAKKINRAKAACLNKDFMIFARIESFIAGENLDDAMRRAKIYHHSAADGLLIHSSSKQPDEIYAFIKAYQDYCVKEGKSKYIICVPTTYDNIYEEELYKSGVNIIIYANHLLRAAHKSMRQVCKSILTHHRSCDSSDYLTSVKDIFHDVGFLDIKEKDMSDTIHTDLSVLLLADDKFATLEYDKIFQNLLPDGKLKNQRLLDYKVASLLEAELRDITIVGGYNIEKINNPKIKFIENLVSESTKSVYSLFLAKNNLKEETIIIDNYVLFTSALLNQLKTIKSDIIIVVDNNIHLDKKELENLSGELVICAKPSEPRTRQLTIRTEQVLVIGPNIDLREATHEFTGILKISKRGIEILYKVYEKVCHENAILGEKIDVNKDLKISTLLNEAIRRGYAVEALPVNSGWMPIKAQKNITGAEQTHECA